MKTKRLWIALAAAPVIAAFVAAPNASFAASKENHVTCSVVHNGKTETKHVATAKDCTDMGGKVVSAKHTKKY